MFSCIIRSVILFGSLVLPLHAMVIGNPILPYVYTSGLVWEECQSISLRTEYFADYVYKGAFQEEFFQEQTDSSTVKFSTQAGVATLNFFRRLDLYGILGSSQISLKKELFSSSRFSWGVGAKAFLYNISSFFLGGDVKYFFSKQKPTYLLLDGAIPADILSSFYLDYSEIQGALSAAYQWGLFIPYAGITYIEAKISPNPQNGVVLEVPSWELIDEFEAPSTINHPKWGTVVGFSLLSANTMTINVEARFINQYGVNISGELRF